MLKTHRIEFCLKDLFPSATQSVLAVENLTTFLRCFFTTFSLLLLSTFSIALFSSTSLPALIRFYKNSVFVPQLSVLDVFPSLHFSSFEFMELLCSGHLLPSFFLYYFLFFKSDSSFFLQSFPFSQQLPFFYLQKTNSFHLISTFPFRHFSNVTVHFKHQSIKVNTSLTSLNVLNFSTSSGSFEQIACRTIRSACKLHKNGLSIAMQKTNFWHRFFSIF